MFSKLLIIIAGIWCGLGIEALGPESGAGFVVSVIVAGAVFFGGLFHEMSR